MSLLIRSWIIISLLWSIASIPISVGYSQSIEYTKYAMEWDGDRFIYHAQYTDRYDQLVNDKANLRFNKVGFENVNKNVILYITNEQRADIKKITENMEKKEYDAFITAIPRELRSLEASSKLFFAVFMFLVSSTAVPLIIYVIAGLFVFLLQGISSVRIIKNNYTELRSMGNSSVIILIGFMLTSVAGVFLITDYVAVFGATSVMSDFIIYTFSLYSISFSFFMAINMLLGFKKLADRFTKMVTLSAVGAFCISTAVMYFGAFRFMQFA
jgi:hypothetical protein